MNDRPHIEHIDYHYHGRDALYATPHRDESIEIVQFWSEGGYFVVGVNIFRIKPGCLLIADAMQTHYSNPADPDRYERSRMVVSKEFWGELCDICGLGTGTKDGILNSGAAFYDCEKVTDRVLSADIQFKRAASLFNAPETDFSQLGIVSSLTSILDMILPHLNETGSGTVSGLMEELADYIKNHGDDWRTLSMERICEGLHISSSYASHLFKRLTGKSLLQYITMLRMAEARRLLLSSNIKIRDISEALRFDNTTTFCRYFKKYVGCTPSEYRASGGVSISLNDI